MDKLTIQLLNSNINAQLSGAYVAPMIIRGAPGINKTTSIKKIAKDSNRSLILISATTITIDEVGGLPEFVDASHLTKYSIDGNSSVKATVWSIPELIERANRLANKSETDGCIICLDDLHMMPFSTQPMLYELLLEKSLKNYRLDSNVAIVGTMNSSEDAGLDGMNSAIINRLAIHDVRFDFDEWFKYVGINLNVYLSSFLKNRMSYVNAQESTTEPFSTARSWDFLSNTIDTLPELSLFEDNVQVIAKQYVSEEAAKALHEHVVYMMKINFSNLVKTRKQIDISKLDYTDKILYAYISRYIDTIEDARYLIDLINSNTNEDMFIGSLTAGIHSDYMQYIEDPSLVSEGIKAIFGMIIARDSNELLSKKHEPITFLDNKTEDKFMEVFSEYLA